MTSRTPVLALVALVFAAGCAPAPFRPATPSAAENASPLGPSYVLLPLPGEDEALLGRVLPALPAPGRSLDETSRPNPCADALTAAKTTPLASTFEDAQEISARAQAKAMLGAFGFEGDASAASHFLYKITTEKRVALTDTTAYEKCCEQKGGCGVGFVSALIHGEGEYATGEESGASGSVTVPIAGGAGGGVQLKVLHRRKVRGYLAALVTLTGKQAGGAALGPLGLEAVEATPPQRVLEAYEREKVSILEVPGHGWVLRTGTEMLTENEFARRYERETQATDLRPAETRRNTVSVIVLAAFSAGALYLTYWGATHLNRPCETGDIECWQSTPSIGSSNVKAVPPGGQCVSASCPDYVDPSQTVARPGAYIALIGGATLALPFVGATIYALFDKDGNPSDHVLTEDDARKFATRYNRAMLRRANQKIQRQLEIERGAKLDWRPVLGPGVLGFGASFLKLRENVTSRRACRSSASCRPFRSRRCGSCGAEPHARRRCSSGSGRPLSENRESRRSRGSRA